MIAAMNPHVRLCLVLHNHQPIGNFDHVFEDAYQDSYLPFLDVFEKYEHLKISLHTSGSLMDWLDKTHPDYLDRLAELAQSGRIEIVGGALYEPILAMIPARDRVGQIRSFSRWLNGRLKIDVRGMWIPERVWEQNFTKDIVSGGIEYTLLDDFHFRKAGVDATKMNGYFTTEDEGKTLKVFPGSEKLRYLIPFCPAQETIDYLRTVAENEPNSIVVFGDDGEKFGTWPNTKKHVYDDGWLCSFFDALTDNRQWLSTCTLAESADNGTSLGKIYLPDCSYREMTEWALPVAKQMQLNQVQHDFENDSRWELAKQFIHGGNWRNFKVKYPETNDMYARMMYVSSRLHRAAQDGFENKNLDRACEELYRGQCNCGYWHGAFGGTYLPHLRNAVFKNLITADNLIDRALGLEENQINAKHADFNFDGRNEIKLWNDQLIAWIAPWEGGQIYEFDVREICHNLGATIARRPESYHEKIKQGDGANEDASASIHDRVVFKQEGLDQRLQYDFQKRNSLIDHFYDNEITLEQIANGGAMERGDFATGAYGAKVRQNPNRVQVQMTRTGNAWGIPLTIKKGVTFESRSNVVEFAYLIEGLPQDRQFHFASEFNLAGLPSGADDRFFHRAGEKLGQLQTNLDLKGINELGLTDEWLGIKLFFKTNRPTGFWTYPVETVSQSESGFELVHQAVVVQPHWLVQGDQHGKWTVTISLKVDTQLAVERKKAENLELSTN